MAKENDSSSTRLKIYHFVLRSVFWRKSLYIFLYNYFIVFLLYRYFKDWVWTLKTSPEMNVTEQIVNCRCPKNAVTYLIRREPLQTGTLGYTYLFACSPQSVSIYIRYNCSFIT